jgi:hypothetical protein
MRPNLLLLASFIFICGFTSQRSEEVSRYNVKKGSISPILIKRNIIKLYPNPTYDGTIKISTSLSDTLHFYIFDLEGTLINQTVLSNKEKKTIKDLKKGTYMYDVFVKDESVEEGKIIVK